MRGERVDGAIRAGVLRGRAVTSVLLVAETEALARRAAAVLEAAAFEVTVATEPPFPPALRPWVVVVAAEELARPWFPAVVDLFRTRGWGRRTLVVAPLTGDNVEAMRRTRLGPLYPLVGLDSGFAEALTRFADGSSWEERASARMQAVLGVTDELCARFVDEAFSYGPRCLALGEVCRRGLYTSTRNLRKRWQALGLPGSPKPVLDRIVALQFAKLRGRGASVVAACAALGVHRSTMYRLIGRVAGTTPGEVDEDAVWAAIEEWVDRARPVS